MRIYLRLCFLCQRDGNQTEAKGTYTTPRGEKYDVCNYHANLCISEGFPLEWFEEGDELVEEET